MCYFNECLNKNIECYRCRFNIEVGDFYKTYEPACRLGSYDCVNDRYLNLNDAENRIVKDFSHVMGDKRFTHNIAITHCNEFKPSIEGKYYSDNPYNVEERK